MLKYASLFCHTRPIIEARDIISELTVSVEEDTTVLVIYHVMRAVLADVSRISRFGRMSPQVFVRAGSANEGCGHVWQWSTSMCSIFQLVS